MRSTIKALSVVATLAMAAGLSACNEEEVRTPVTADPSSSASAETDPDSSDEADPTPSKSAKDSKETKGTKDPKGKDDETSKSGAKGQKINPVTFKDQSIGLTQTCDQVIEDYAAPKYKQISRDDTVHLLHCTLEFNGDLGYSPSSPKAMSLEDKTDPSLKADEHGALLTDDLKADGLETFDVEDYGTQKVEGWFAFVLEGKRAKLKPFSEGGTSIVYNREDSEGSESGKFYPAYSDKQDLVLK